MQKWKKENPRKPLFIFIRSICIKNFKFLHEMTCALDHKQFYNGCIAKNTKMPLNLVKNINSKIWKKNSLDLRDLPVYKFLSPYELH